MYAQSETPLLWDQPLDFSPQFCWVIMTEVEPVLDFASSGRTGRRNALPDILGSPAGVSPTDLPLKLAEMSLNSVQSGPMQNSHSTKELYSARQVKIQLEEVSREIEGGGWLEGFSVMLHSSIGLESTGNCLIPGQNVGPSSYTLPTLNGSSVFPGFQILEHLRMEPEILRVLAPFHKLFTFLS
ncbi:hypothetical protein JRQ81_011749 [Phrynocephalus forsythii]|uniref:Uncharacterized protein n=1 Tax=Phrynocephalus forsythii TaxID=171643 RepID=A0A9Q1AQF1_9SAUR|nr:hypothetical protein JRQ81_011749 [Phrynocephalus forsythii]